MPRFLFALMLALPCLALQVRMPDVEAQRTAMKKLSFLVGKWSGEARVLQRSGEMLEMLQTEEAQYKLDGLVLTIEGMGRSKADGKPSLQAFGLITYDDGTGAYRMRAYNDGRWLETDVKLAEGGRGLEWGFSIGEYKTHSVLRMNEKGEWTESAELVVGAAPPRKLIELTVRPRP